jgi:MSHA biogenesis protein MshP
MSISCLKRARGSAIIVAIFLLVVLASLGAFIVSITSSQQIGGAYDVLGARAYQAAHYGSEWGAYRVLKGACSGGDFCALCQTATYAAPTSTNLSGLAGNLSNFTVTVSCGSGGSSYTEGGTTVWVYQLTANACNQPTAVVGACPNTTAAAVGGMGYIERRVSLTVTN